MSALAPAFPLELVDDRGRSISLDHFAARIVSLSPNITELVFAAGAGDKLVGVSRYSDYPETAKSVPDVGDASNLDLERIIALKPDLVIAWVSGNARSNVEKLEKLGLTVFATEATRLEDIPRLLRITGKFAGTSRQAEAAARVYEEELRQIRQSYSARRKVSVFQLIWHQPLITVNENHVISDIIRICGGVNVFGSVPSLTPVISPENLLAADPQAIISSMPSEADDTLAQSLPRGLLHVSAISNGHIFFVPPDLIQRQTIRLLRGAKMVCQQLERVRTSQENEASRNLSRAAPAGL